MYYQYTSKSSTIVLEYNCTVSTLAVQCTCRTRVLVLHTGTVVLKSSWICVKQKFPHSNNHHWHPSPSFQQFLSPRNGGKQDKSLHCVFICIRSQLAQHLVDHKCLHRGNLHCLRALSVVPVTCTPFLSFVRFLVLYSIPVVCTFSKYWY